MSASESSDVTAINTGDAKAPVVPPSSAANPVRSRIDFALLVGKQLLIYGWVLGFSESVYSACIGIGDTVIDLTKQATAVRRTDVAQHFGVTSGNDDHGFYALLDLPVKPTSVRDLKLSVALSSGEKDESRWPVSFHDARAASVIGPHLITLKLLLPNLSKQEAERLIEFARPALGPRVDGKFPSSLPPPTRFGIDLCCVLENRLLVVAGWLLDPANDLAMAELRIGDESFRFLEDSRSFARPDINPELAFYQKRDAPLLPGFIFIHAIPQQATEEDEVLFVFTVGAATARVFHPVNHIPHGARQEILSLLAKMEAESALLFIEHLAAFLGSCPDQRSLGSLLELIRHSTIARLPLSIQNANPRYSLFIDQVIRVADKGIFLMGWFNAGPLVSVRVVCHCGSSAFVVSDHWSRHSRADVTAHLANEGVHPPNHEHGFCCYIPLSGGDAPCYLSAETESGEVRQVRATVPAKGESALQTVRALVTSFNSGDPQLGFLMDHQIGPAVGAIWAARQKPLLTPTLRIYGARPTDPSASIVVPLYGRHDFAEYQMALFADDPDFQDVELIYVVDDPAIAAEFTNVCADLYGMYQVPFVVASYGANLGFAGACNFGAEVACGPYLFFVNSDVLPKQPRWVGDLLRVYKSLSNPGVLGAKLLYEDGSIQHAGIAFRRFPGWANLWINDHPFKGQSPQGLEGVREIDAVTAACAVIEAPLFHKMGGFSEDYIIGDFEDSDLCLRLVSAGRQNYIALDIELYHLERQSQNRTGNATWRTNLTLYNCWLHNSRWGDLISSRAHSPSLK